MCCAVTMSLCDTVPCYTFVTACPFFTRTFFAQVEKSLEFKKFNVKNFKTL